VEKIAFVMTLKPGFEEEYKKRHDQLWPELALELKNAGVSNYSIYLHRPTLKLFATLDRNHDHTMADLPNTPALKNGGVTWRTLWKLILIPVQWSRILNLCFILNNFKKLD